MNVPLAPRVARRFRAILAMEGGERLHRHIATSLRVHVYNPLMRIEKRVTGAGEELP